MTIDEFIAAHKITMRATRADKNPWEDDPWEGDRHWSCRFCIPGQPPMLTWFSQSSASTKPPTAAEVLNCLALDCRGIQGMTFEDWARDYGYDPDSRRAEKLFRTVKELWAEFYAFLGDKAFRILLNEVDPL